MEEFQYNGYTIKENGAGGFHKGDGLLAIQSLLAFKPGGEAYVFAFSVNFIVAAAHEFSISDPQLIQKARKVVQAYLDNPAGLVDREEYTFEYSGKDEAFNEVKNAGWWVKNPH